LIGQRYIEALKQKAKKSNTFVVNMDVGDVSGVVSSSLKQMS
jgi:hypothetical protein